MVDISSLCFSYHDSSDITEQFLLQTACEVGISEHIKNIKDALVQGYKTEFASLSLPYDHAMLQEVVELASQKRLLQPTLLLVIGIGGSALGTKAIYEAIKGRFYHATKPELTVYFLQTIDTDRLSVVLQVLTKALRNGSNVIVTVITKSGTTTETLVNFDVVVNVLRQERSHDYHNLIVIISDEHSPFHMCAQREGYAFLSIPKAVGGRYSVFSPVGLFPLAVAGIDIHELVRGARDNLQQSLSLDIASNHAVQSALLLFLHYKRGISIHDMFLFSIDLETLGKWYRQLMGESIGKEFDCRGRRVYAGITPTVSLGTIDLHSVAQLYLGGPKDKYTTFVTIGQEMQEIMIPAQGTSHLGSKRLSEIMDAFVQGTQRAYLNNGRPFSTLTLSRKNEYFLGQCMQHKMVEMMYLGYLLQVDPFDQPNVELYKKEVALLLKK